MPGRADRLLLAATALAFGLMAGFFFAYSASVMPGLARTDAAAAAEAMRAVNRAVRNPVFGLAFFGTAALAAAVLLRGVLRYRSWPLLLAVGVYLAGVVAVTAYGNVPMNRALAALDPAAAATAMPGWIAEWVRWNHLRAAAALLACALLLHALLRGVAQPDEATARPAAPGVAVPGAR